MKHFFLTAAMALSCAGPAFAQDPKPSAEQFEFFEKRVRPVLAQHCFECHSARVKRPKGGLLLDSRAGMLEGGDIGPALIPGQADKSRLIEAVRHINVRFKMPPKYKLPDAVIADLTTWVQMGAPWPDEKQIKKNAHSDFNLAQRKQDHWCWQPIATAEVPKVRNSAWSQGGVDRFLLAKLEAKGLKPAPDADPRTLMRRLYFDLVGLPPPRAVVEEFVQACATGKRQAALEAIVDRLLASPQFGERWARHWLDLVRYAESRGHEFDFTIPNAFHYRDYVIRAFNRDVPYNQFVREHIAGDLLAAPRLGEAGMNESILGTAFWFLGEECHSPVDIRQDQADRFDNRIDVMTKTFLGLTVACARCHDHKFDAISTKDYYALFGILESSNYRLARFDTITQHRQIAAELRDLEKKNRWSLLEAFAEAAAATTHKTDEYLLSAAGVPGHEQGLDLAKIKQWQAVLASAAKEESSPLYAFARAAGDRTRPAPEILAPLLKRAGFDRNAYDQFRHSADIVADFSESTDGPMLSDDSGFRQVHPGVLTLGASAAQPIAHIAGYSAAERDLIWDGIKLAPGTQNESGSLGGLMRPGRTLRTPEFTLKHEKVYLEVKGSGTIYAGVGQHIMLAGPLHGSLVQKFNTGARFQWIAVQLAPYKGQRLHLEITPADQASVAVVQVVQTANPPPATPRFFMFVPSGDTLVQLAAAYKNALQDTLTALHGPGREEKIATIAPLANWMFKNAVLFIDAESAEGKKLSASATPVLDQQKKLLAQVKFQSRLAPAMQDGSGTDGNVFVRGNPKTPGTLAPRRFLEAFAGSAALKITAGSGRRELAQQMTDPTLTPLLTRVYVNRVWHHLFGRGIVASPDNFGVLGEAPTHPELLDFLASQFVKDGWSTKQLIRALVLTRAYQMSSQADESAEQADPQNLWLHRARLRRLEGEAIRDAILQVSGRLNATMFGPSVPVYLTPFQEGRGRPASGPLDGDGRRSIYLAVRRNFLSSFLLAFDTPAPFSTVGRRTTSNVPAQALILMNDPFVHAQADLWARRLLADKESAENRVRGMYLDAFARPPSDAELRACIGYLGAAPDLRRWADLAHVLINTKEFYFVN